MLEVRDSTAIGPRGGEVIEEAVKIIADRVDQLGVRKALIEREGAFRCTFPNQFTSNPRANSF